MEVTSMQNTSAAVQNPLAHDYDDDRDDVMAGIKIELIITDAECASVLISYPSGRQRDEFARQALRIGVLSLRQAKGVVDGDKIRNEGDRLLAEMASQLGRFQQVAEAKLSDTLKEYFDPKDGRLPERIERFIKGGGELERVMRDEADRSRQAMEQTLSAQIGENSPLLQLLLPTEDNQLLQSVRDHVAQAVQVRSDAILKEFSLDNKDGALARLLGELTMKHGNLTENLSERIGEVIKEFSLDSEDSALSRLIRQVEQTQKSLSAEFSLDAEDSALARLRREMLSVLEKLDSGNRSFREEVLRTLDAMKIRKEEAARSTTHGLAFERLGFDVIEKMSLKAGDFAEFVGNSTGAVGRSKVGDSVVTVSPESAASGARVVIEFKQDNAYTIKKCLDEIEDARKNRLADVGIFVHSKRSAPDNLGPISRFGKDILVVWDAEDEGSDIVLLCALSIAKAISVRAREANELPVNTDEMEESIRQIENQVSRLDEIRTKSSTIRTGADSIIDIANRMQAEIGGRLAQLDLSVTQLKRTED